MMEVKQNTAVDLNDLLTPAKSNGANEGDDSVMADISESRHDLVNCEIIKTGDKTSIVDDISNGNVDVSSLINDVEVDTDINVSVNSELEDALLAEDDVLPKLDDKQIEPVSAVAEDYLLADKVDTSNSTTSSSNLRDPGDDLDTLLSKINDIVEDCIEKEVDNNATENSLELPSTHLERTSAEENNVDENVLLAEDTTSNTNHETINEKEITASLIAINEIETISSSKPASETIDNKIEENNHSVMNAISEEKASSTNTEAEKETSSTCLDKDAIPVEEVAVSPENNTTSPDLEPIQDKEISLNNSENQEEPEKIHDDVDNAISVKSPTDPALNTELSATNDIALVDDIKNATALENDKITSVEETKVNEQNENDDSDDEIVFYVDKPPEIKEDSKVEEKAIDIAPAKESSDKEECEETETQKEESSTKKTVMDDDDVVLLLDDDDEELNQSAKKDVVVKEGSTKSEEQFTKDKKDTIKKTEPSTEESKDIEMDNSDNARDDFVPERSNDTEKIKDKTESTEAPEEANSNCSSSSNLLQEAKSIENNSDEPTPEDCENEEEDDEGEVEVIENDLKEVDSTAKNDDLELAPPAKRLRLNEDNSEPPKALEGSEEPNKINSSAKIDDGLTDIFETKKTSENSSSTLKRTHDVIELETEEKSNDSKISNDSTHKKPRTSDIDTEMKAIETVKDEKPSEDLKLEPDFKTDIKAVPSYEPIPLYPPPKFGAMKSESSLKLDFLKKFRKSFDNMTKQDLEELVLQKVVEAIIHRSEFSEMRELVEKQEKLITAHRSKISELSKQFRDLEMVHNRVVKDIEQRNSQFIMPVKITRAVGLQVYIPTKKVIPEAAASVSSSIPASVSSSPQRPLANQASSASSSSVNPAQRQFIPSQAETSQSRAGPSVGNTSNNAAGIRRGCVQKVTPIRPVPGTNQTPAAGSTVYRNTPTQSVSSQPRILNKNAAQTASTAAVQRTRYIGPNQDGPRLATQQQISRSPNVATSGQRAGPITTAQAKSTSNAAVVTQRSPVASSSSSIVDNYINTLTHLTGSNTAVSITPAKPKEKAVIDLTDEDEAPAQTSSAQPTTTIPVANVQRRSLPGQSNTNSPLQYGRPVQSLSRAAPANQNANNKNRQMSNIQAQKNNSSFNSISTPSGTSITRISVSSNASNVQRVKYSHPAPLPATPPQAFNPAWKLPPPRPTIRISNLDNGIVISWTMEESMDRHAECVSYQIYAYQETSGPPMVDSWRHVGDVKAMLLPMAVTLTQFQEGQRYFFAVRAVDCHQRYGPFSLPKTWS